MDRPTTKVELLRGIREERQRLENSLKDLTDADMVKTTKPGEWSVKDILAHVSAWEDTFIKWYQAGLGGGKVDKPNFRQAGVLSDMNRQFYEANRSRSLKDVFAGFKDSYQHVLSVVESVPEKDMFTRGKYAWTGSQNLAVYIIANTSEHYPAHLKMIEALKKKLSK
jgi:hypothetical protein